MGPMLLLLAIALAALPRPARGQDAVDAAPDEIATFRTFDWGYQRPNLLRYNRVEGLSVGGRGGLRSGLLGRPLAASLTGRIGFADLEPRGALAVSYETLTTLTSATAYRELEPVEPATRALGLGNTLNAALFGRDDGDYFQAAGADLTWRPSAAHRPSWRVRLYAERQEPVLRETDASVFHAVGWDDGFRGAAPATRADQAGVEVGLSPAWGHDPEEASANLDLFLQAERGDFDFRRGRLQGRVSLPLARSGRLALALGGGATRGDAPPQRRFILGGPFSLRGFAPGVAAGPAFGSVRAELIGPVPEVVRARGVRLALFADGGWAGDSDAFRWGDAVASWGVGVSILDGILRLDAARSWKGPSGHRVDLYLDGPP